MSASNPFPNFRHSVDDEPQDWWTVEELLQWCLLQSHKATDEAYEQMVDSLLEQFAQGEQELWALHEELVANNTENTENTDSNNNNVASSVGASGKSTTTTSASAKLKVEIEGKGPYNGQTFFLNPKKNAPCLVGRSAGRKFRERGISLKDDGEVSTTHGKYETNGGKFFYIDTGSTNGTKRGPPEALEELEPDVPYELSTETILTVGQTVMKITIL